MFGKWQKGESWSYLEQEVNGVSGEAVEAKESLLVAVEGERWGNNGKFESLAGREIASD